MTGRVADGRPGVGQDPQPPVRRPGATHNDGSDVAGRGGRDVLAVLAVVLLVAALVPPLSTKARTVEALEALQFALLALAVPALAVLGAPWRRLGLAAPPSARVDAEGVTVSERPGVADRVAAARRRHRHMGRSLSYVLADMAVVVAWRVPASVDALARHGWLSVVEAVTLVPAGIGLWLELVGSSPFAPRLDPPKRMAVAVVSMWVIWATAYVVGLSHGAVYTAFAHSAGQGLSVPADQAVTTGVLWFVSLCAFVPVVFTTLMVWLRSDDDHDDALYRLMRDEHRAAG